MWALALSGMGLFEVQKRRGGVVFLQPQFTFRSTAAVKISLVSGSGIWSSFPLLWRQALPRVPETLDFQ